MRKKVYMIVESLLCALTAGLLMAAAIRMYVEGATIQASGELFYYIYTRDKVGAVLMKLLPLITAGIGFGWVLGIRDETQDKPAALKGMDIRESVTKAVPQKSTRGIRILRVVVLIAAVALIIMGVRNGGLDDVFAKGASICTECVGLG